MDRARTWFNGQRGPKGREVASDLSSCHIFIHQNWVATSLLLAGLHWCDHLSDEDP